MTRDPGSKSTPALWPGLRYPQASQISEAESASCFPDSHVTRASGKKKKAGGGEEVLEPGQCLNPSPPDLLLCKFGEVAELL